MSTDPTTQHPAPDPVAAPGSAGGAAAGAASTARTWAWALAAGLLAAVVSAFGGEEIRQRLHYQPALVKPANWDKLGPYAKQDYIVADFRRQTPGTESRNAALAAGLLGASLGGLLGLAGGLARRSVSGGLVAAAVGLAVGALAGGGVPFAAIPMFYKYQDPETGLLVPLLTHLAIFTAVGAAAGLAFGLGLGGPGSAVRGLLGGICGGIVGTAALELAIAMAFPMERLEQPIPEERIPRLLIFPCVAILVAACAVFGTRTRKATSKPPGPAF